MSWDLGIGILSVLLTVAFFVIGYRQTIGAKRERVRSANQDISDILLRRFALESEFSLNRDDIQNFVLGKAIDGQVNRDDLLSLEELWVLLYARVVSSDYISPRRRRSILDKLDTCFSENDDGPKEYADEMQAWRVILLGIVSAILAIGTSVLAAPVFTGFFSPLDDFKLPLALMLIASALTALALVLIVSLRERSTGVEVQEIHPKSASEFEKRIEGLLDKAAITFQTLKDIDLLIELDGKPVVVELKTFRPVTAKAREHVISQVQRAMAKYGADRGYIVVSSPLTERMKKRLKEVSTNEITFLADDDFAALISACRTSGRTKKT